MRCLLVLAACVLGVVARAQTVHPVGHVDVEWSDETGQAGPLLRARVMYPALFPGEDAPLAPRAGGWPVIVFLHGYSYVGSDYVELGAAWTSRGFVVVLQQNAQYSYLEQVADATALHAAVVAANRAANGTFAGALDSRRIAIAGHSMGGGALGLVLAENPGYRCGFAIAPVSPGAVQAARIVVPFGVVVGKGDPVTPWLQHSLPYYQAVAPATGLKFHYALPPACGHMSLVGLAGANDPFFHRTVEVGAGFFRHFLDLDHAGLEACVGPEARRAPELDELLVDVAEPRLWATGTLAPGRAARVSIAAEAGLGGILAAASGGWRLPTALGTLRVDPSSAFTWASGFASAHKRLDAWLSVPPSPSLVGAIIAFQAIGPGTSTPLWLGSAVELTVGP